MKCESCDVMCVCMIWWWIWYKTHAYFILVNPSQLLLTSNPYWRNPFPVFPHFWCCDQDGGAGLASKHRARVTSLMSRDQQGRQDLEPGIARRTLRSTLAHSDRSTDQIARNVQTDRRPNCGSYRGSRTTGARGLRSRRRRGRNFEQDTGNQCIHRTTEEFEGNPHRFSVPWFQNDGYPKQARSSDNAIQAVTTLLSLSSGTNTISVTKSQNGVMTQSPTVFSGGFALGYPASSVDLGISSSLPPTIFYYEFNDLITIFNYRRYYYQRWCQLSTSPTDVMHYQSDVCESQYTIWHATC